MKWPIPAHQRLLDDALLAVAGKKIRRLIVAMPPQHGKQLANSELVATASGWKRHGDLVVGDEVFGVDGGLVRVLWVSAESADKVLVTFTDGGTLKVHPNHEWTVYDRARAAWRTVETKYLQGQSLWAGGRARFQLPAIACLQYPARDLAVDPYTLGAWLGDGATTTGVFCGAAEDFEWIVHRSACAHGSIWVHAGTGVRYCTFLGIRRGLRQIGVLGHKHIPAEYQISSEAQRRALLAGLVDTDGNVLPTGQVRFITCSRELADGVVQLVRGLGYRTKLVERKRVDRHRTIRDVQPVYEVGWTPHDGLGQGTLPRKMVPRYRKPRRVGILSVTPCPPEAGRCIQVDSPDGLYLVGENLLPTHNSTAISACFPAWYLATYPDERLLLASYASHFASWWGGQARDMFEAWAPAMTGAQLDPNMGAASWWGVKDHRGYMATAGAGGSFIGRPASGVIIDDPHAGAMEAKSDLVRQRIWEWYISVLHGRLTPDGFIVIVMSRWHEDDLVGRLLTQAQKGGEQWTVLHLPAIAITQVKGPDGTMRQVKDALGRPEGAALWPERGYDESWMQETRRTLGTYYWSAQYQGQPSPDSGGLYVRSGLRTFQAMVGSKASELVPWSDPGPGETKTWSAYKLKMLQGDPEIVPDHQVVRFSTVDTAFGLGDQNDYTVIAIWGILPGNRLALLHIDRERREGEDIATEIVNLLMDWKCQWVEVESVEWLIQMIKRKGWRAIKPLKPQGDKTTRAQPSIIMWNNGDCYIPSNATWGDDFAEELAQFDKGAHDDQVDVFAYAALSVTALANRNRTIPLPLAIGPRTSPWQ